MASQSLGELLGGIQLIWLVLWLGLTGLAITLLVLMRTPWGQVRPLRKCVILALLTHVLLAIFAMTVQIVGSSGQSAGEEGPIPIVIVEQSDEAAFPIPQEEVDPPEANDAMRADELAELQPADLDLKAEEKTILPIDSDPNSSLEPMEDFLYDVPLPKVDFNFPKPEEVAKELADGSSEPRREQPTQAEVDNAQELLTQKFVRKIRRHSLPKALTNRRTANRLAIVKRYGGSEATQGAVKAALAWLASVQSPDGRWDSSRQGAGREKKVAGHDRRSAGREADTGITGLVLLAFLGSAHTHLDGPYQQNIQRGLDYLMSIQGKDGNLCGRASTFARMYCHAMALFALSEVYAMTGDENLHRSVQRAVNYTVSTQHPKTGGWRYKTGDPGDTSQLGWQLMALRSARLSGIEVPSKTRKGIIRFLHSVSVGHHGGLASYRPGQRPSRTMTAEALVCRQLLGMSLDDPAMGEAGDQLLKTLPGQLLPGEKTQNFYYYYYGTLAAFQLQGVYWDKWNQALTSSLVGSQEARGSWTANTRWGGYGGKIYATAMATMCLEVYYRYLPLYGGRITVARRAK